MAEDQPQKSINYWVHALSSSLAKGAASYYGHYYATGLPQMRILSNLHSNGELTARDLVATTAMDKGLVSRVLAGLKSDGLVAHQDDGSRTRLRRWTLTADGKQFVARLQPEWLRREAIIQASLSEAERRRLTSLLERMFHVSENLRMAERAEMAAAGEDKGKAPPARRSARVRS